MTRGKLTNRGAKVVRIADLVLGGYISTFGSAVEAAAEIVGLVAPRLAKEPPPPSIDQRLAKLEVAKNALLESLTALEELEQQAEEGKLEHARVRAELEATIASKDDAERKLQAIQALMTQDIAAFQTLAGVPNVRREHLVGFGSGVLASLIASGMWGLGAFLWKHLGI